MYAIRVNENTANQVQFRTPPVRSDSDLIGFFVGDNKMLDIMAIPLTRGLFALVDGEDYEWLSQWKWFAHWNNHTRSYYAARTSKAGKEKAILLSMSREILGLKMGDKCISDHINRITLDNRRHNLRIVTYQQNAFNRKNVKGCGWDKKKKKYRAYIVINNKQIHLGYYGTEAEAREKYLEAKKKYHLIPLSGL